MKALIFKRKPAESATSANLRNTSLPFTRQDVMPPKAKTETKLSKALKKIRNVINIFNFMVLGGFFSIIFGKDINTDHVLLGYMSEETRKYWSLASNGLWLLCFIIHASCGPWSKLKGFQGSCHRIICIACVVLPVLLKMIEPAQIWVSVCPIFFTVVVEVTGHFIKITIYVVVAVWLLLCTIWNTLLTIWKRIGSWIVSIAKAVTGNIGQ